ncbi:MAG TPA: ABC transporter permease [Dermatophilaceae bacterium]
MALDFNASGDTGFSDASRSDTGRTDLDVRDETRPDDDREVLQGNEMRGLDALELGSSTPPLAHAVWRASWPKLAALAIALGLWQLVAMSGWKASYVLPGPVPVFSELGHQIVTGDFWTAVGITMTRGVVGFAIAAALGLVLGVLVAQSQILRAAIGSLITGLQTMPSIAWFPLAILLFQLSEQAILFVILIGAVPSIANGVIGGVDYVPVLLVRAGRNVGASGLSLYRHVVLPAALPSIVTGLKQGWAFAWRSLLAGELMVSIANRPSLGQFLNQSRELGDTAYMIALMIAILTIGIAVDAVFSTFERGLRRRRGVVADRAREGS